jgi:hypothetical protein
MKKTIQTFIFLLASVLTSHWSNAQHEAGLNLGVTGVLFDSDASEVYGPGFSFNFMYNYSLNESFKVGVEVGLLKLSGKEINIFGFVIPVDDINITNALLVGSYVAKVGDIYLEPGVGLGIMNFSGNGDGEAKFGVSPRIVAGYPITDQIDLRATIPFNFVLDSDAFNFWGVYVGGVFKFGN